MHQLIASQEIDLYYSSVPDGKAWDIPLCV